MKTLFRGTLLITALFLLTFSGCDDDEMPATGTIEIVFVANYDGQPLDVQASTYGYPDGSDLKVLLFQYYLSDLELVIGGAGVETLSEIELIRYNVAGQSNEIVRSFEVPAMAYTGLQFGVGVKPELNNQPPANFPADFVLNEAEYWNDMVRYVFAKIEANVDLENDGTFDTPVSYHMGSDAIYNPLSVQKTIDVQPNGITRVTISVDVLDALAANGTDFQDFGDPDQRIVHGGNQAVAREIWDRLVGQFRF